MKIGMQKAHNEVLYLLFSYAWALVRCSLGGCSNVSWLLSSIIIIIIIMVMIKHKVLVGLIRFMY